MADHITDIKDGIAEILRRLDDIERKIADIVPPAALDSGRMPGWFDDAEVRAFLDEHLFDGTLDTILARCVAAFGEDRSPSRSALGRYRKRLRRVAAAQSS